MNRLLLLNSTLVESVASSTIQPAVPVTVKKKVPIAARGAWAKDDSSYKKEFHFSNVEERNSFLYQILAYEHESGHHATMLIKEKEVAIHVTTFSLGKVTELDRDYARAADQIYEEIKDVAARRASTLDERSPRKNY